jgi:cytochrome c oxidase subunit 1
MGVSPILVVFGAIYHWYPKITGRMLNDTLGRIHFWLTFVGTYAIYLPMYYLGILGLPRRYYAYGDALQFIPPSVHTMNAWISVSVCIVAAVQLIFLFNLVWSLRAGKPAGSNPWRSTRSSGDAHTPPKHSNWGDKLPVHRWAYDYSVPGAPENFTPPEPCRQPGPRYPRTDVHASRRR